MGLAGCHVPQALNPAQKPPAPSIAPSAAPPTVLSTASATEPDRSPNDVALTPDGKWAVTANATANSVSLVSLAEARVAAEVPVGKNPFAVAVSPDGARVALSHSGEDSLMVLRREGNTLVREATIIVGQEPRGVVFAPNGKRLYVAVAGEDMVAAVDVPGQVVTARWAVDRQPWHLALYDGGKRLLVGCTNSKTVVETDTRTGKRIRSHWLPGRNLRHIAVDPVHTHAYVPLITGRGKPTTRANIDRGWVIGSRLARLSLGSPEQPLPDSLPDLLPLDVSGDAVGDPEGCAVRPNGAQIALSAGGSHELVLMDRNTTPFVPALAENDHLPLALRDNPARFRRVRLGGCPRGIVYTPDGNAVVVANYLRNSVQVVEAATGTLRREIFLGGPSEPTLARRGEALFLDADRSFGSWFSCNTCHTEGATNSGSYDTRNDGGYGLPKRTPDLRGAAQTAPYTWHGWTDSLEEIVRESLVSTMQGPAPSDADVAALTAYIASLRFREPETPKRERARAIQRGKDVFTQKGCATCHTPPTFTTPRTVATGGGTGYDRFSRLNPPSLRGVGSRAPLLHDGRAATLEEALTRYHRPTQTGADSDLTPAEQADLIAYLRSL